MPDDDVDDSDVDNENDSAWVPLRIVISLAFHSFTPSVFPYFFSHTFCV